MRSSVTLIMTYVTCPQQSKGSSGGQSAGWTAGRDPLLTDVLGLLAAALKPARTAGELAQITRTVQREIRERGIRPIRQFLVDLDEGYGFYHARFHEFVTHELLYEDELPHFHAKLASWPRRSRVPDRQIIGILALAHHLDRAGDRDGLWGDSRGRLPPREKIRRFDYVRAGGRGAAPGS